MTPKGIGLHLEVLDPKLSKGEASCAIRKDAGDDPDVTDGLLIYATVRKAEKPGVTLDGGEGVGRVTRVGLEQAVGDAAINKVPRQMIREGVEEICRGAGYTGGLSVIISIPGGEELARKTFNPRLGIVGGISVLGTSRDRGAHERGGPDSDDPGGHQNAAVRRAELSGAGAGQLRSGFSGGL